MGVVSEDRVSRGEKLAQVVGEWEAVCVKVSELLAHEDSEEDLEGVKEVQGEGEVDRENTPLPLGLTVELCVMTLAVRVLEGV